MTPRLFQIGVNFQPVEVEKNVFAPAVEEMILEVGQTHLFTAAHQHLNNEKKACLKCQLCCCHCPRKQVPFQPKCVSVCV